jgi:hypothetical protein
MLIEMVAATLTVFSGFAPFSGYFSSPLTSPIPKAAFLSSLPEEKIVAMFSPINAADEVPDTIVLSSIRSSGQELTVIATPTPTPTNTPTPTPTNTPTPTATPMPTSPPPVAAPVDLESLFSRYADEYHVDKELLKRIAKCESSFNSEAANGDYVGMFQFASGSWSTIRARMGMDQNPDLRKNSEETIKTAAYHIANGGQNAWPSCK